MGASLALAALDAARRVGLSHAPTRLLVRFALAAVDSDPKPWARLSMADRCAALGHDDDTAGRRAVERATAAIVGADLAALSAGGNRSGAARYALRLAPVDNRESPPLSGEHSEEKAHRSASESPPLSVRKPTAERGAKEDRGDTEEETRASAPPADARCTRHRGTAEPPPCIGCRDARLAAEASAAATADAERALRAAALATLDPAAVEALSRRLGGRYSAEAIIAAARAEMPGNLPLGLTLLANRDDLADAVARWER